MSFVIRIEDGSGNTEPAWPVLPLLGRILLEKLAASRYSDPAHLRGKHETDPPPAPGCISVGGLHTRLLRPRPGLGRAHLTSHPYPVPPSAHPGLYSRAGSSWPALTFRRGLRNEGMSRNSHEHERLLRKKQPEEPRAGYDRPLCRLRPGDPGAPGPHLRAANERICCCMRRSSGLTFGRTAAVWLGWSFRRGRPLAWLRGIYQA